MDFDDIYSMVFKRVLKILYFNIAYYLIYKILRMNLKVLKDSSKYQF